MPATRCPICDTPMPGGWQDYPQYPFCTERCRLVDLGRWLGEGYRVPGDPPPPADSTAGDD